MGANTVNLMLKMAAAICAALLLTWLPARSAERAEPHIPTAVYCCHGYANDTVSPAEAAPYVTWANTDANGAAADHAGGIMKVVEYVDVSRVYTTDRAYPMANGGPFSSALAVTCQGVPITTSPAGVMTDPYKPATLGLLENEMTYRYSPLFTAYFVDDIDAFRWGMSAMPCTGNPPHPWTEPATAKAYATLLAGVRIEASGKTIVPDIIMNGLSQYADKPAMHTVPLETLTPSNVLGGMCEGCFGDNTPDAVKTSAEWQDDADLEIKTVRMHKIYWDYVRYIADNPGARLYTYASFMLAWDPRYTIYQTAYKPNTPGTLHVTPETQFVAHEPLKSGFDSIDALRDAGGTYVREYRACYDRGVPVGPCAFVVNSETSPRPAPRLEQSYRHTMRLSGGMVLEGGTVALDGPAMPPTIPATTAFVLTR